MGFEQGGKVVALYVKEGDQVIKGTPIAQLDISQLKTQKLNQEAQKSQALAVLTELTTGARRETIEAAQARVAQLQAKLNLEKIKKERREYLHQEGAISQEDLDEVVWNYNILLAQLTEAESHLKELRSGTRVEKIKAQKGIVQQIEANIKEIDLKIAKSLLKAPYSGTIAQRTVDEGTVVSIGESVVRLVETGQPEVRIGVPLFQIRQLKVGDPQSLEINNQPYRAIVSAILPEVNPTTRTQTVILTLESNPNFQIPKGAIARLNSKETITVSGFWLPIAALVNGERGLWSCYAVVNQEQEVGIVESRDIEILYTQSDRVLVRGTLQAGDVIITQGTQRVVPGQKVAVNHQQ